MKTTFAHHFFSVFYYGLGQRGEFRSAMDFAERMGVRFTRTHYSNDVKDASEQVIQLGCPHDAVFGLHRPRPEFAATVGNGYGFPRMQGMNISEAIMLHALRRNECAKGILFLDGADTPSITFERQLGDCRKRLYYAAHSEVDWAKHFVESGLFVDFLNHFGGVPEAVGA